MPQIPRDTRFDSTLALMRDPYRFIARQCHRFGRDLFQARILLRPTICMLGQEAAKLFYDPARFIRAGAPPGRVVKSLFGPGSVQNLDGEAHHHRKQLFLSLITPERVQQLAQINARHWREQAHRWTTRDKIMLYPELCDLLTRTVCEWAGVPLPERDIRKRSRQLTAMFDSATVGQKYWRGRMLRKRAERWIANVLRRIRAGELKLLEETPVRAVAMFRDPGGQLLDPHVAAVELLNILRPTVGVAVFITFMAHALERHPECRAKIQNDGGYPELFIQEVRRYYPFFPSLIARVRQDFDWNGYHFPQGVRVMLDLYGTNHDLRVWKAAETFWPERFSQENMTSFNFVSQDSGDTQGSHHYPVESIAMELMKIAASFLATGLSYDVPRQDLRVDYSRLPGMVRSKFIIQNVQIRF